MKKITILVIILSILLNLYQLSTFIKVKDCQDEYGPMSAWNYELGKCDKTFVR